MFTELPFGLTLAVTVVKLADVVIAPTEYAYTLSARDAAKRRRAYSYF